MRQPARRIHRRQAPRWLLVLGVLSALLPQAARTLHTALERHVRCAAHGELMHADAAHAVGQEVGQEVGRLMADQADFVAALRHRSEASHGHTHCSLWTSQRALHLNIASIVPERLPGRTLVLPAGAPATPATSIPLLLLSPKTSPPT